MTRRIGRHLTLVGQRDRRRAGGRLLVGARVVAGDTSRLATLSLSERSVGVVYETWSLGRAGARRARPDARRVLHAGQVVAAAWRWGEAGWAHRHAMLGWRRA